MRNKKEKPVANAGAPGKIVKQTKSATKALFAAVLANEPEARFVTRSADNQYKLVKGKLILRNPNTDHGYQPDGDSIHLKADNPDEMKDKRLFNYKADKVELADGNFQLRFEEIDATELHYREQAQPLGAWARDRLLSKCGFSNVVYGPDGKTVIGCDKWEIEAYILFKGYDVYGRPISYVFVGKPLVDMKSGTWINLTTSQLKESLNYELLIKGIAYLTIYTSSPEEHRQVLISAARQAQKAKLGVWAIDKTNAFTFTGLASVGPDSKVSILPKIFRRLVDYFLDGGSETMKFPAWLLSTETTTKNRNDVVIINGTERKKLSDVITHEGNVIKIGLNLFECVFEEQEPVHPVARAISKIARKVSASFRRIT